MEKTASLDGKTCVVTGATSGIGEETALGLAKLGARVVLIGRDPERAKQSVERVRRESGNDQVESLLGNFASLDSIRRLADDILEACPRLDVLVNNAGIITLKRETTDDGFESMFGVNHLGYFALTHLLLDRIIESAPARIVNVASDAHRFGPLDPQDLQSEKSFGSMKSYGRSKSANILFTQELARRLEGRSVTVNCLHPGAVATRLGHNNGTLGRALTKLLSFFILTPERGAETSIYLASSPEVDGVTGRYFAKCRQRRPSAAACDDTTARHLWDTSVALTGLGA
jgi:NAD(P)-dependent dehydrogenase (short-subunit alcohol dehydrogenase family)